MNDLLIVTTILWTVGGLAWFGLWRAAYANAWKDRDERRHCLRMAWLTPVWPFVGAFLLIRHLPRLFREAWLGDPKPKPAEPSRVKRDKQEPGKWSNYDSEDPRRQS